MLLTEEQKEYISKMMPDDECPITLSEIGSKANIDVNIIHDGYGRNRLALDIIRMTRRRLVYLVYNSLDSDEQYFYILDPAKESIDKEFVDEDQEPIEPGDLIFEIAFIKDKSQ